MRVATLNVRNTADRWRARRSLLVRQLVALDVDIVAVQELRVVPDQAAWICREAERLSDGRLKYHRHRATKSGWRGLWEGIGVLSRVPVMATATLPLGAQGRLAQRVTVRPSEGGVLDVYNTHLGLGGEVLRSEQAGRILAWMATRPAVPAVLMGDLNARPGSPTIELLTQHLRSAHAAVHGQEPARTVPTPLRRGATGPGSVLDYVLVNRLVEVVDARLAFDEVDGGDPTLCASDHYGLVATLALG